MRDEASRQKSSNSFTYSFSTPKRKSRFAKNLESFKQLENITKVSSTGENKSILREMSKDHLRDGMNCDPDVVDPVVGETAY